MSELEEIYERLRNQCGLTVSRDTFVSLYSTTPKLSISVARAVFRPSGAFTSYEHAERITVQRSRRSFLRGLAALGLVGVFGLITWNVLSQPQAQAPTYVSNPTATSAGRGACNRAECGPELFSLAKRSHLGFDIVDSS